MAKQTRKGHFIVFEGTDGSGKATQVRLLRKKLQMTDFPHEVIEFPRYMGNPYGKLIGNYLRGDFGDKENVNTYLISLAYAGDRALAAPQIRSWLKEGKLVIADRYVASNKAYQTAKLSTQMRGEFIDWLDDLEYNINGIPREELVIYLHVPTQISYKNIKGKKQRDYIKKGEHDIHERDTTYQNLTSGVYLQLANEENNWVVIDCVKEGKMLPPGAIHSQIVEALEEHKIL